MVNNLAVVSVVVICVSLSCTTYRNDAFDRIPSCSEFTEMLKQQLTAEDVDETRRVFGEIDTLHVVAQVLGGKSPLKEETVLLDSLISNIERCIPQVVIVKGHRTNEASLLLLLDLERANGDMFYGFVSVALSRDQVILRTKYKRHWEVWSDEVAFCEKRDPGPRILWLVQLQATKFSAMWTIGNQIT